jgi:hypothetical protein
MEYKWIAAKTHKVRKSMDILRCFAANDFRGL